MSNEKLEVVQYIDAPWNPLPLPFYPFTGDTSTGEGFGKHIAGEMAVVHNVIIRALNTLYINAPLVKSSKGIQDFTGYALEVLQVIHEHHETEEAFMFPPLEGKVDMNINVEQHRKFEDGMEKFESYVKAARNGEQGYDSERWRYLLQEFATPLIFHLGEEIKTIQPEIMARVDPDILGNISKAIAVHVQENGTIFKNIPFFLTAHKQADRPNWPPLPGPLQWLGKHVFYHVHSNLWKFAPFSPSGEPNIYTIV